MNIIYHSFFLLLFEIYLLKLNTYVVLWNGFTSNSTLSGICSTSLIFCLYKFDLFKI